MSRPINARSGLAGPRSTAEGQVITAIVPNAKNTASQDALIRALKWKR